MAMDSWGDNVIQFPLHRRAVRVPVVETSEPVTFAELAQDWLSVRRRRIAFPVNDERHIKHLRALWLLTEKELRPRIIGEALGVLSEKLSPATVNKIHATGRRIIRAAMANDRWEGNNPFLLVDRMHQKKRVQMDLSISEVRALLPHLRTDRRREALAMLYLGLRPGELKGMRRADVDLHRMTLIVRRSNDRDQTKTGKERRVPIPDVLAPLFKEAMEEFPGSDLIFGGRGGKLQSPSAKLSRTLKHGLRKAGLVTGFEFICRRKGCGFRDERQETSKRDCPRCGFRLMPWGIPMPIRFYDLRHSAATLHREAGADPLAVQILLGHAPENLTDGIYTHMSIDRLRIELNKLLI